VNTPPYSVVLDVDTGIDDAFAVWLALRHLKVLGITTVAGNAPLSRTTENTLKILELAGRAGTPVAAGADRPLAGPPLYGASVHGDDGLADLGLPAPRTKPDRRHAVQFLADTVRANPGCWLIPTAPLTNIALALRDAPDLAKHLGGVSLMGGSTSGGNVTPAAEYNIYADPEAAAIVFASGVPIKMAGLNLTRQADIQDDEVARVRALGTPLGAIAARMLEFYNTRLRALSGRPGVMHDPCAVAWMIDPSLVEFRPMHVAVELLGSLTRGMTVCDMRREARPGHAASDDTLPGHPPNAEVGIRLVRDRFFALLWSSLAGLG
jgi:pyrimidine-specific ribonucleoside hydrolase